MSARMAWIEAQRLPPLLFRLVDETGVAEYLAHDSVAGCVSGVPHQAARAYRCSIRDLSGAAQALRVLGEAERIRLALQEATILLHLCSRPLDRLQADHVSLPALSAGPQRARSSPAVTLSGEPRALLMASCGCPQPSAVRKPGAPRNSPVSLFHVRLDARAARLHAAAQRPRDRPSETLEARPHMGGRRVTLQHMGRLRLFILDRGDVRRCRVQSCGLNRAAYIGAHMPRRAGRSRAGDGTLARR